MSTNRKRITDIRKALLKNDINEIENLQNVISGRDLRKTLDMNKDKCNQLLQNYKSTEQCGKGG